MKLSTCLALVTLLIGAAHANADHVDDYIRRQMETQHIPAVSLAVMRHGNVVKSRGYGFANLEWRAPATADTVYEIGSVTKQFTATLIMMLVEEGKIGLDDKITTYLTDLPEERIFKPLGMTDT